MCIKDFTPVSWQMPVSLTKLFLQDRYIYRMHSDLYYMPQLLLQNALWLVNIGMFFGDYMEDLVECSDDTFTGKAALSPRCIRLSWYQVNLLLYPWHSSDSMMEAVLQLYLTFAAFPAFPFSYIWTQVCTSQIELFNCISLFQVLCFLLVPLRR